MSYVISTATSHTDFYNKLITFLTTDATLVSLGQAWTTVWTAPGGAPNATDIVLKGPGLAGADEIYIGLRLVTDTTNGFYTIFMCGMSGILPGATEYDGHTNCSPSTRMFLTNGSMNYWLIANGRRFVAVAKVSTVYESLYGGLILPYSLPSQYPYPLFIGGTAGETSAAVDWRGIGSDHTMFHKPYNTAASPSGAYLLSPTGAWMKCGSGIIGGVASTDSDSTTEVYMGPDAFYPQAFTISPAWGNSQYDYKNIKDTMTACYGGAFPLTPITLNSGPASIQTWGILHGIHSVPGIGNSAENVISISGVDYLVLQNVFRGTVGEYMAVQLEA